MEKIYKKPENILKLSCTNDSIKSNLLKGGNNFD
jgi:hypothetical protein